MLWETGPGNYCPPSMCQLGTFVPITAAELEDLVTMTEENREPRRRGRSSREAVTTEEVELPPAATAPTPDGRREPAQPSRPSQSAKKNGGPIGPPSLSLRPDG